VREEATPKHHHQTRQQNKTKNNVSSSEDVSSFSNKKVLNKTGRVEVAQSPSIPQPAEGSLPSGNGIMDEWILFCASFVPATGHNLKIPFHFWWMRIVEASPVMDTISDSNRLSWFFW
jgi:hypothetical protein